MKHFMYAISLSLFATGIGCASPANVEQDVRAAEVVMDEDGLSVGLSRQVEMILDQDSPDLREYLAGELLARVARIVREGKSDRISDAAIADMERLLDDEYTAVIACMILAKFGTRARNAIPTIERAIAEMEAREREQRPAIMRSPVSSARVMREQLALIGGG